MIGVDNGRCTLCGLCVKACPFGAVRMLDTISFESDCKMCGLCVKACPQSAIAIKKSKQPPLDKSRYHNILVYVEHNRGVIHPVTYELLGKAAELAAKGEEICALLVGFNIRERAAELISYGANRVFVYDDLSLQDFRADLYTDIFADCLENVMPSVVLVGATATGRSLAPRVATRMRTGLTADCTSLQRRPNSDLVQIRPAFGGNIMAQILTTNHRPQFATVRYKVMQAAEPSPLRQGEIIDCRLKKTMHSGIEILQLQHREPEHAITDAQVLVVAGRAIKDKKQLKLIYELADLLGGEVACTRPLVESGMMHYTRQIGLSGRTVKPNLIITCGVFGAVQFTAGMNASGYIVAINQDACAPIFEIAHLGLVGELNAIVSKLIAKLRQEVD